MLKLCEVMSMNIFTISSLFPMPQAIAQHVLDKYGESPHLLSRVLILLPSRRAIKNLREAFLQLSEGRALLLPQMMAIGDIEESFVLRNAKLSTTKLEEISKLSPAVKPLDRLMLLATLVLQYGQQSGKRIYFNQAVQLADQLAEMLDELHREQADMAGFEALAPEEFAKHWQETLQFLKIIREFWPAILSDRNEMEIWQRRNLLLQILAEGWQDSAPDFPIIVAGTTGSIPKVADLLKVIAGLPKGEIILPALDTETEDALLEGMEESHPQYGMLALLGKMKVERKTVPSLQLVDKMRTEYHRERWMIAALLPANATESWQKVKVDAASATQNIHYLSCDDQRQEALTIAMLLREVLETPAKTAALVTNDRQLARNVATQMKRWDIAVDDSAGLPLSMSPAGNFVILLLQAMREAHAPVNLLALLKHPVMRMALPAARIRSLVRELEKNALRGLMPSSWMEIQQRLSDKPELQPVIELVRQYEQIVEPLAEWQAQGSELAAPEMLRRCITVLEALSKDESGKVLLWHGDAGKAIAMLWESLIAATENISLSYTEFCGFIEAMLRKEVSRSSWQGHARLQILSPMEARMLQCDRVILGGMNEGSWPAPTEAEPWLNRSMRKALGLPALERQTGLLAHDFLMLASLTEVFLTRAEKSGGTAMVASRFIQRMEALLHMGAAKHQWQSKQWQHWAEKLDNPAQRLPTLLPPEPCPPVSVRPRKMAVTTIEKLMRDPYGVYARYILKLKKLDPLQQMPSAREFGNLIHKVLENFVQRQEYLQPNAYELLLKEAEVVFAEMGNAFMVESLWKPRFKQIATWLMTLYWPKQILCEVNGSWNLPAPSGDIQITARLDRMDITEEGLRLIDYKTGSIPSTKELALGLYNQLMIAAIIVREGGFGNELATQPIAQMSYWKLAGGRAGGEAKPVKFTEDDFDQVKQKLINLLIKYDNEAVPYRTIPDMRHKPQYNDYEHLARVAEWSNH